MLRFVAVPLEEIEYEEKGKEEKRNKKFRRK
jgi:hypothetical protein